MQSKIKKLSFILKRNQIISALILLIMMIIGVIAEMLSISMVIPILGIMQNPNFFFESEIFILINNFFAFNNKEEFYVFLLIAVIILFIIKNIYLFLLHIYQTRFVYNIQKDLSQRLFSSYIKMPYRDYIKRNSSTLIRNTIIEVEQFASTIMAICMIFLDILLMIGLTSIVIIRDPISSIFIILTIGIVILLFQLFTRSKVLKLGMERQESDDKRMLNLQQGLGGVKEIKIFGREKQFNQKYSYFNSMSANILASVTILRGIPKLLMESLAVAAILILVISTILSGGNMNEFMISLGLFVAIAFKLFPSLSRLLSSLQIVRYAEPIINLIYKEIKNIRTDNYSAPNSNHLFVEESLSDIEIRNIVFNHDEKPNIIDNLNLSIQAGSTIGILGESGVGKSTLLDIFMGLLEPKSGTITYNKINIFKNLGEWRNIIGYVPQNIYLIDDTLKNNIAYGLKDNEIDQNLLNTSINEAQLNDFINELPENLETIVGERGIKISGGQKQRIGIARALYHNPKILILDESTSSLDLKTEQDVMHSIHNLNNSKTVIIISHKKSTLQNCDKIFKLENKTLKELQI